MKFVIVNQNEQTTELYHFGIKGQKWGIRRFQNPDGTLTAAGRKRYLNSDGSLTKKGEKAKKNPTVYKQLEVESSKIKTYRKRINELEKNGYKTVQEQDDNATMSKTVTSKDGRKIALHVDIYKDENNGNPTIEKVRKMEKDALNTNNLKRMEKAAEHELKNVLYEENDGSLTYGDYVYGKDLFLSKPKNFYLNYGKYIQTEVPLIFVYDGHKTADHAILLTYTDLTDMPEHVEFA
jgi:hypothetical protein